MWDRIIEPGRNCFGSFAVEESGVYVDGAEYYSAFYRAALKARRYIIISGWQFDSEVSLVRGPEALRARREVTLLKFLDSLCRRNPELRVYILAWDFSLIFLHEREWMQEVVFNWSTSERLLFRFDGKHAIGASQHQKYTVIDGAIAFLGGMDFAAGRWDDRRHLARNPERTNPDGKPYAPYHDMQAYFTGPLVSALSRMFEERWRLSAGSEIPLPGPLEGDYLPPGVGTPIQARDASLSRTQGKTFFRPDGPVKEIRALFLDAITAARKLVYIESQYFSSHAIYRALTERMEDGSAPKLDIVIILPKKPHALVEELSVGLLQARILGLLRQTAKRRGHSLGIYYSAAPGEDGEEVPVYIHSKVMIVDDRFLTVGSANATNRSMGLDSELNISWEACSLRDLSLIRSIREFRAGLLTEHIGTDSGIDLRRLKRPKGLVEYLDYLAETRLYRLQRHDISSYLAGNEILKALDELLMDPEKAIIEENVFEIFSPDVASAFSEGMTLFKKYLFRKRAG
ncbi:phospholipase [bacterium]|nr:phospholipase [bacterium]